MADRFFEGTRYYYNEMDLQVIFYVNSILSNTRSLPRLLAFTPFASRETIQDLSLFLPHPLPLPRRYMIASLLRNTSLSR
jgi:hypothetical protein